MQRLRTFVHAAALALPLAVATPSIGADKTVSQTTERAAATLAADTSPESATENPLYDEVRQTVLHERCVVLALAPKNLANWLSAIDEFLTINEKYRFATDAELEAAGPIFAEVRKRLEKERRIGKRTFVEIMNTSSVGGRSCGGMIRQI